MDGSVGGSMLALKFQGYPLALGLLAVVSLALSSCVTTKDDLLYLNDQIVAINDRVNKMEKRSSSDLDQRLEAVRLRLAQMGADLDKTRADIQVLSGKVEENNFLTKRAIDRDTTDQDTMRTGVSALNERLAKLETEVKRLNDYVAMPTSATPAATAPAAPPTGTAAVEQPRPQTPRTQTPQPPALSPEEDLYESALSRFKGGKSEEALAGFKHFLANYPKSKLADNAQFWIGECYFSLRQYEQAILAYQEVIKNYPGGNKVPNAMLRQALAFNEIKDATSAKLLLKKIIKTYPNSSEAKIAEAKLKTMN
jgi:tol-pal system protein YbgF